MIANWVKLVLIQPDVSLYLRFAWFDSNAQYLFTSVVGKN